MSLLEDLKWRYATKKMNGTPVSQEKIDYIIEAARLAPTSSGLHPYKVIEISNPELKAKIQPVAYGQSQIVDSSHLLIFAAYDEYTKDRVDAPFAQQAEERGLPAGFADDYKNNLFANISKQTKEQHFNHAARQAYIGFGLALAAAAEQKVDATPMEGFVNAQLDELLELDKLGLKSVTILALGYRDEENDWLVNLKKVRPNHEDFIIKLK
ncbi:nitroreductase family protein [Sphingobacterium sp. SRCM116780]|uniref:nitroreductase family protein n=1 Tax=Sphingobacterium sp. SRCM116780 TaxID=2907623 RepID=UPI001F42EC48|nr:nitroreductase family protein [Sphingobacterium sp. SRCM116780]UIR57179.1 nitroreductase family protein [Sphingobacterium sp. SRCM116780]